MSQSQTTFAHGRYSKRKRAQVNYYSSDSEGECIEIEQDTQEEYGIPKSKKRRSKETSKKKKEEKPFPFLELPAEIRNIIYGLCLKDPSGINIVATITKRRRTVARVAGTAVRHYGGGYSFGNPGADSDNPPVTLIPSLLATNKQIHKEARDILYDHEFTMTNPMALHSFMINLGPRAATYIKRMALVGWVAYGRTFKAYNHAGLAMLSWATNLQRLRIDTSMGWNHNGKLAAQQFYRDGFSWLETLGILKGQFDAAVDVVEVGESVFSRGYRNSDPSNRPSHDDMAEDFRKELRKLLNAQRQRILASPAKRVEKSKPEETSEEEQVPPAEGEDGNGNEEENLELDTFSDENSMSEDSDLVMEGFILSNDEENEDENDREEVEIGN